MKRILVKHSLSEYVYWGFQIRVKPNKEYPYRIFRNGEYKARRKSLNKARLYIDKTINRFLYGLVFYGVYLVYTQVL